MLSSRLRPAAVVWAAAALAGLAGCGGGSHPVVPMPGVHAAACRTLIAHLPADLVPGQTRHRADSGSPYIAVFGSPAVTVTCGVRVPAHDPTSQVEEVDGVDWLALPVTHGSEHLVSYHSALVVDVLIPHAYLPADVLAALSPLVTRLSR